MTSEENLQMFMQDYHRALNNKNFGEIVDFLDFPFVISLKGAKATLTNIEEVMHAFGEVARVQEQRGVAQIVRNVFLTQIVDLREAIVGTEEEAFDSNGNALVKWRTSYLLARRNGVWRLTRANATNYDEAWEKAGRAPMRKAVVSSLC